MENRLCLGIESQGSLRGTRRLVAELDATEIQRLHHEIAPVNQIFGDTQQFFLVFLIGSQSQRRYGIFVNLVDMFLYPEEILHGQNTILRNELKERHELPTARYAQFRHNGNALLLLLRELCIHLESTDTVYLIAKKVDAVGIFGCIGEHIDNATTQGILPRLIDIVHPLEAEVRQDIHNSIDFRMSTHFQFQCTAGEFTARHDFLCHRFGTSHDTHVVSLLNAAQHLGTENLVSGVFLSVLNGPTIRRRKEQDIFLAIDLRQVVVEIARLFHVVQDKDDGLRCMLQEGREEERGSGGM